MSEISDLGPLAILLGTWEGNKGTDLSPSDKKEDNRELATSLYRERMVFESTGRVDNHEQQLLVYDILQRPGEMVPTTPFTKSLAMGYGMQSPNSLCDVLCRHVASPYWQEAMPRQMQKVFL